MPREYTKEEVREHFLETVWSSIHSWDKESQKTPREKLEGLAFSLMVLLDGGTGLPRFIVAPSPHEDDKKYHLNHDENYFAENHKSGVKCDISGGLHELFYKYSPESIKGRKRKAKQNES